MSSETKPRTAMTALLCLLVLGGCAEPTNSQPVARSIEVYRNNTEPEEPEPFRSLRKKAANLGIKWHITCAGDEYIGGAHLLVDEGTYVEDGARPSWNTGFVHSEKEDARKLLTMLDGKPNVYPEHRPKDEPQKQCRDVSGGNSWADEYAEEKPWRSVTTRLARKYGRCCIPKPKV